MIHQLIASILAFSGPTGPQTEKATQSDDASEPPNVIMMIGDGMGVAQMSTAFFYGDAQPQFTRCPVTGLITTSSATHKITDSAAGATAFSTGSKTFNGAIGVDADSVAVETILEYLAAQNYSTGLIATSSITHATPASYFAHVDSRNKEFEIAEALLSSPVDFFAGGGRRFFFNRLDERNLYPAFAENDIVLDTNELKATEWEEGKRYGYLLSDKGMPRMVDGRGDFLPDATSLALDFFQQRDKPFFMMVEGSQIDWGGHANDGEYLYTEMLDFDNTIGRVLDFAEAQGNTLVIITADHECGGFSLVSEEVEVPFQGKQRDYDSLRFGFSSGGHSATMVPVLSAGPHAENFGGIYDNTLVYERIMAILRKY